ncbi:hypothetical protein [Flavobacterium defluvii]|uniref:Uncharacterized protein n=1 Tax=Flavobacterium defluvii TaxID=370979 RepID=A0A1M5RM06_9FLAO|nr:hypothetical protein [Flavobacterium defluvii]SHH27088.1 hypothetical protein SAMN05443663_106249 [Flavobacterium defluvii]
MSTNHNRIKVADLERNQANKTLITNRDGELEFCHINTLKPESYNALDYTSEGRALDARQGKVLKDMIDNKQVDLASDLETQIDNAVPEDKKVISRLKLFNWWTWIKSQTQTISATWNFKSALLFGNSGYFTSDSIRFYMRASTGKRLQIGVDGTPNDAISIDSSGILLRDKLTLNTANTTTPALILPNSTLTSTPQNGSIERDQNGILWETHAGIRSQIMTKDTISSISSSDTYLPSLDNILNFTGATLLNANYTKIGNTVSVKIALTGTPKALGSDTEIGISLPINRNSSTELLSGICVGSTVDGVNFSALVYITGSSTASIKYKLNTRGTSNIVADFSYAIN